MPFHEGELSIQSRANATEIAMRNAAVIDDAILPQASIFIEKQNMVVLGSIDERGNLWSSLLFGPTGFVGVPESKSIHIQHLHDHRDLEDPLWKNILEDARLGLLFIELSSRRRYRVNGRVKVNDSEGIDVTVDEAYPNCPKYIQRRHGQWHDKIPSPKNPQALHGQTLTPALKALLAQADTLFVTSAHPEKHMDVSHRGGAPGFAYPLSDTRIRIPDYKGNHLFNTLGNFAVNANAGILVVDFETKQTLQLTGKASIHWDEIDEKNQTGGTRRYWDFELSQWILRALPTEMTWEYLDASPFNPIQI